MFQAAKSWIKKLKATRLIIAEKLELKAETLKVDGAVSISTPLTILDTTDEALTLTLADGYQGQVKTIIMTTRPGSYDAIVTANLDNYGGGAKTTLTFNAVGETWVGIFYGSEWYSLGTPTATVG